MPKNNYSQKQFEKDVKTLENLIRESQKGGRILKLFRIFSLYEVDGKKVDIKKKAYIKYNQFPLNAARKLLSYYCKYKGIKSDKINKVNITFTIKETTNGDSKVYGPYKGKLVKYDEPLMVKLKNGKIIKHIFKPNVKLNK